MKGLLLKEWYMMKKYCRSYVLIVAVFIALSFSGEDYFMTFYPVMMAGMIPFTLLAYDEQSKWNKYCGTLPYSKAQIVSVKYLAGVSAQMTAFLLNGIALAVKMVSRGTFRMDVYLFEISMMLIIPCMTSSLSLPFCFKLGVEKGRLAYVLILGLIAVLSVILVGGVLGPLTAAGKLTPQFPSPGVWLFFCLITIALYAFSWYLSISFYKKREDA